MAQQLVRLPSNFFANSQSAAKAKTWALPISVQVSDIAKTLIAANENRTGLSIINDNPSRLYVRCATLTESPVTTSSFDRIIPAYSTLTFEMHEVPTTAINALAVGTISGNWVISESAP